jgi:hypothetical protein
MDLAEDSAVAEVVALVSEEALHRGRMSVGAEADSPDAGIQRQSLLHHMDQLGHILLLVRRVRLTG